MADFSPERSGFEPELGGFLRDSPDRTGFEPELGGLLRQKAVYVDEVTCIGCKHCAHVAPNTFFIEGEYGRSRVYNQDGDEEEIISSLEEERKHQVIKQLGFPQIHKKFSPADLDI